MKQNTMEWLIRNWIKRSKTHGGGSLELASVLAGVHEGRLDEVL